jgi:hypothetical protein
MNKIIPLRQAQERQIASRLGRSDLNALTSALTTLIKDLADT